VLVMVSKDGNFGERLKTLRNKKGKNQEEVAYSIGISRARYSHYENNHVEPDMDLLKKIAKYYNVSTDYLLGNELPSEEDKKRETINKIVNEFPDADLMFKDLANMSAEQLEEVYEFIKFKMSLKGD